MKYLKKFNENIENDIKIGEYVICEDKFNNNEQLKSFIRNNIGQFVSDEPEEYDFDIQFPYIIKYKNIPDEINIEEFFVNNKIAMIRDEIIHHSPNEKDLQIYIDINKYNL